MYKKGTSAISHLQLETSVCRRFVFFSHDDEAFVAEVWKFLMQLTHLRFFQPTACDATAFNYQKRTAVQHIKTDYVRLSKKDWILRQNFASERMAHPPKESSHFSGTYLPEMC